MATYTEGSIVYEVSLETRGLLENSGKVREQLLKLNDSGEIAAKGLNKVDSSAVGAGNSLGNLSTIAKAVSAALVSSKILAYAQSWNELEDRISNTGATARETQDILNQLVETSNRNGRTIEESSELYIRLSNSMSELGYSTNDTLSYIDTLSNLMTINKTNTISAESAINALTKAQMEGKLAGRDAMSVFNAMPSILKTLGTQLNKTEAEVRQMAANGKLSMQQFSEAMIAAQDETAALADNMRNNVNDGITRITNNFKKYFGELNNSTGATKLLVDSLILMSEHVDILATGVGVLGAIYAGKYITSLAAATKQSAEKVINDMRLAQSEKAAAQAALQQAQAETANARAAQASLASQLKLAQTEQTRNAIRTQLRASTAALTVATNAEAAAQSRLSAAMQASSISANVLKNGLALLGGPAGILLIVAGAFLTWSNSAEEAKKKATDLSFSVDDLTKSFTRMNEAQREAAKEQLSREMAEQVEQIRKQKKEIDSLIQSTSRRNVQYGFALNGNPDKVAGDLKILRGALADMESKLELQKKAMSEYESVIIGVGNAAVNASKGFDPLRTALDGTVQSKVDDKMKDLSLQIELTEMKLAGASKSAYIYENSLNALGDAGEQYKETIKGILDGTVQWSTLSDELRKSLEPLISSLGKSFDANEKLKESQKKGKVTTKSYAEEVKTLRDKLEVAKLEAQGLTVEAELLSLTQKMGSKATASQTAELKELISASQAYKALGSLKSPAEVEEGAYQNTKQSLEKLFQLGELKQNEYNAKIEQLEQKHHLEMIKLKSEAVVSPKAEAVAQVDPVQALANENAKKLALINDFEQKKWITEQNAVALREAANHQYEQNRINAQWEIWKNQNDANSFLASSLDGLASSATSTISGLASGTMSATESMQNFANVILNEAVGSLVQMGLQYVKNAVLSQSASAATTSAQIAEAAVLAAAYQPAAMYASIATSGSAATLGSAAFATSIGTMKAISIAGGREHGGTVNGNNMYRVGEGGKPEILMQGGKQYLIPGENGRVLSNKEIRTGQSGGGTNLTINMPLSIGGSDLSEGDGKQLASGVKAMVEKYVQNELRPGGLLNKR